MEPLRKPDNAARRKRGPQKTALKQAVSIRLSPDILEHFRATGTGWQTRMDAALREWIDSKKI